MSTDTGRIRAGVIYSAPAPYLKGLFERVARRPDMDLKVYFLGRSCGVWNYEMENGGDFPQEFLDIPSWLPRRRYSLWLHPQIPGKLEDNHFQVVIIAGYFIPSFLLAIFWCRLRGIPYLLWSESHEGMRRSSLKKALRPFLLSPVLRGAAGHLAVGAGAQNYIKMFGIEDKRIFHLNHSADVDRISSLVAQSRPMKEQWKNRRKMGNGPVALFVGRIDAEKGIDDLMNAYAAVARGGGDAPALVLVGRGKLLDAVKERARREGWSRVYVEGFVPPEKVWEYYAYADFLVLPSREEPYGVVVQEAMAAGLPVIVTSAVGAAADFVTEGETGYVIPPGDIKSLAEKIVWFRDNSSLLEGMRGACEKAARRFDQNYGERQFVMAVKSAVGMCGGEGVE